ncbi:LacI family DNA-binding transcriptional regulator [Flavobacterium sp. CS20]|uniref:LacI family DNA-binding transcriptional regulator n=1 Tax=Flavobacterium sp. CS20 TaxID=2775246 RepID=UPI001B3A181C|nr:LacI family DNA-binding transcriptional regulator [Flavobacterium sp. CS20]QTY27278.1 LacI family DNA-binding transcriptional regulator [Flavobacterium sp. CS20]
MKQKTTLKQLSKELNVSVSTVSKALNNSSEISTKTIKRVKELAKLYGYKPNPVAVSLKRNKTLTIGILIPNILNHFFAKVLHGIEQEASKKGYKIIICLTNESLDKEREYLEMLEYNKVDGVIATLSQETQIKEDFKHFKSIENPLVLFDRVTDEIDCHKVLVDDNKVAQGVFEYLKNQKRKKIAVVSTIPHLSVSVARLQGVMKSATQNSMSVKTLMINEAKDAETKIDDFFKNESFDALIGLDETAPAIAINTAKHHNINIPKDLAIVGFTDGLLAKYAYPKMSVVSQHAIELGENTVKILLESIEDKSLKPKRFIQPTSLIKRASSE